LPVLAVTNAPTATVCIQLPAFDTMPAVHTTAKSRCRIGRNDDGTRIRRS
jgi:hypothetical protein